MGLSVIKGPWQRLRARFFSSVSELPKHRMYIYCKTGHILYSEISSAYDLKAIGFVAVGEKEYRLNAAHVNMIVVKD